MPERPPLQATSSGVRNLEAPSRPQKDAGAPRSEDAQKNEASAAPTSDVEMPSICSALEDYHGHGWSWYVMAMMIMLVSGSDYAGADGDEIIRAPPKQRSTNGAEAEHRE
eukprot:s8_g17.t1